MKVVHRPVTVLVARPALVPEGVARVLADFAPDDAWRRGEDDTDGEGLPELHGRLCYGSFGSRQGRVGAAAYLGHVVGAGHGSVLEHAVWSFVVLDGSRGLMAQMTRHRAGFAWSVESTHFVKYAPDEATVCLPGLDPDDPATERAADAMRVALEEYAVLWESLRPESGTKKATCADARALLPTGLRSRIGFSANARALRHFCELRGAEDNVKEIRAVAADTLAVMRVEAPSLFADFEVRDGADGFPVLSSQHRKV